MASSVVRSASQYRLAAGASLQGLPAPGTGSGIFQPLTPAPQTLPPLGTNGEIARFEGTYLVSIPNKRVDVIPMEMVFKRLLDIERQDPTLELTCIISLTVNKLCIYSKATNDLVESLPLLLVSTTAAVMNEKRLPRHSQLVLVGFWPSVKLSDALRVSALRARGQTPSHQDLAPGDVHVFNLLIPPQRPVPVARILVDRLNAARKKLGLQLKDDYIERVRLSEMSRDEQLRAAQQAASDPDLGFGDEHNTPMVLIPAAQLNFLDPLSIAPGMFAPGVAPPNGMQMQMQGFGDQQMMVPQAPPPMPPPPPLTPQQKQAQEDIMIVNQCIDEFEEACRMMRSAAQAEAELRRRLAARGSADGQYVAGDGMLIARVQLGRLTDEAFVDIVRKFKLALNLLAMHQQDLHNPNHADILRSMWPLFEQLVRNGNRMPLAAQVFTPLLSSEAIGMLTSCLASAQRDFWHSLGDAWVVSRDQAEGQEEPYAPVFKSGFKPTFAERTQQPPPQPQEPPFEEPTTGFMPQQPPANTNGHGTNGGGQTNFEQPPPEEEEVSEGVQLKRLTSEERGRQRRARSEMNGMPSPMSGYSPSPSQQQQPPPPQQPPSQFGFDDRSGADDENFRFLEELKVAGAKTCVVNQEFAPKSTKELHITKGEYLEVLNDSKQWWLVRNRRGNTGFVPSTILSTLFESFPNRDYGAAMGNGESSSVAPPAPPPPPPAPGTTSPPQQRYIPRFAGPNVPSNTRIQEHSSVVNELHSRINGTWDDSNGAAPNRSSPQNRFVAAPGPYVQQQSQQPDPAPQPYYLQQPQRKSTLYDAPVELPPPPPIMLPKPIKVPLTDRSTPEEARKWCLALGLQPSTLATLNGKSGLELLTMKDYELKQLVPFDDYKKLSNRLLLVKNKLGWQSLGKKQLAMMLAWRKSQVDSGDQPDGAAAEATANGGGRANETF